MLVLPEKQKKVINDSEMWVRFSKKLVKGAWNKKKFGAHGFRYIYSDNFLTLDSKGALA